LSLPTPLITPISTLVPYTTLFRSLNAVAQAGDSLTGVADDVGQHPRHALKAPDELSKAYSASGAFDSEVLARMTHSPAAGWQSKCSLATLCRNHPSRR